MASTPATPRRRADAQRNAEALLEAAAAAFRASGVDAPVRDIAARAGVGVGTVYRHFPTRAELVVAVFRHQVESLAQAGPQLLASSSTPYDALTRWVDHFVDFLVTKHGLAEVLHSDDPTYATLHSLFVERLLPVLGELLSAAAEQGQVTADLDPYALLRGVGNLCIGSGTDPRYDSGRLVRLLLDGLRAGASTQ